MLTFDEFDNLIDDLFEEADLSKAMIDSGEEDPIVAVNKMIGISLKKIMESNLNNPAYEQRLMSKLLKDYNKPIACHEHGIRCIDEITRKCILFCALNTILDDDDDYEEIDKFDDFS